MQVSQSYKYDSSPEFGFVVEFLQSDMSLFSNKLGFGGIDFLPAEGATVTIYSKVSGVSALTFKPTLNNKFYWLVSNDVMTDRDTILSQATPLSSSLVSGRYEASFVYTNPDNYQYLYLISDFTNNIVMGSSVTHTFANKDIEVIDTVLEPYVGLAQISYSPSMVGGPIRFMVEYEGNVVADTGYISPTSGSLKFVKKSSESNDVRVIVENLGAPNSVLIKNEGVALTSFYISTDFGTLGDVCSQIADYQVWHNGTGSLPVAGDIIYEDADGFDVFDGGNAYHVYSSTIMVSPSSSSLYAVVLSDGSIPGTGTCACSEVAAPSITQGEITVVQGQEFSILVEATNNPLSWDLITSCNEYSLDGGARGATFTYDDCDSIPRKTTSGVGQGQVVCASTLPVVASGTGTVTSNGPCMKTSLPRGITFRDGILSGKPETTGRTEIELTATNCFGTSSNATFDVVVQSPYNLRPFDIDIMRPVTTGAAACLISGTFDILYHNGSGSIPVLNDTIFVDYKAVDRFVGGKVWYMMSGSLYSIQIDEFGTVIDTHTC